VPARGGPGPGVADPLHLLEAIAKQLVRAVLDDRGDLRGGRPAVGRVVLEAAVLGRVVRRGHHNPVREPAIAARVIAENRPGHRGRRRVPVPAVDEHAYVVGGEHLECGDERGLGQRVRIAADEQRPRDACAAPVVADGLGGRGDVIIVERQPERGATVARGAEDHLLPRVGRVRMLREVRGDQPGDVHKIGLGRWLTCPISNLHRRLPPVCEASSDNPNAGRAERVSRARRWRPGPADR
jgi:hypothetical protein